MTAIIDFHALCLAVETPLDDSDIDEDYQTLNEDSSTDSEGVL
jgi:hypothetical protein